jgi:hypothetical protein
MTLQESKHRSINFLWCYWNPQMTDWEDEHMNKSQIKNDYKNRSIKTLISGVLLKPPNDRLKRWTYKQI